MIYLFLDENKVKVLSLKKSLLGQYETSIFSKTFQSSNLLEQGKVANVDFVASAVKEALQSLAKGEVKERETLLILPQESYSFFRIEIPLDIAPSAIAAFVKDKAKTDLPINLDECSYDYFLEEGATGKFIHFFAVQKDTLEKFQEALQLIELKISAVIPESVTYFTLFQKTLRKDKKENIFFVTYDENQLTGIHYDSSGQVTDEKWTELLADKKIEQVLKVKVADFEQKGKKLNRLILAGEQSDKVRQDTFTKEIGVWTNPLKRIFPEFYQDYLKILLSSSNEPFSVLSFEACVGGFIFHEQHKKFSLLNNTKAKGKKFIAMPKVNLLKKELLIFLSSFLVSFGIFYLLSKMNFKFNLSLPQFKPQPKEMIATSSPLPKNTATPTPKVIKEEINIKVLNGSGTPGKAGDVRDILKEKGYQEILTGNADNFEYDQSELQVKKTKSSVSQIIKNDLKENVAAFKETVLSEDEAADVVIIVGSDFK